MVTSWRTRARSYFFLFLLVSQSLLRVHAARTQCSVDQEGRGFSTAASKDIIKTKKIPDLDWPGCKAWTRWGCPKKEGCEHNYIWLDTLRQSCRYSDKHKLLPDQVSKFFPTELARLEEKSTKFAKTGCIYGGWWMKCQRRMTQILRLFSYVNKAYNQVLRVGAKHPAYELVANEKTKSRISQITKNMGTGFGKHSTSKKFCFDAAMKKMEEIPAKVLERKEAAIKAGQPLSEEELANYEKAQQSAAMMAMTCSEVNDEQTQELQAQIESSGNLKDPQNNLDAEPTSVDDTIKANSEALKEIDKKERAKLEKADEPDDEADGEPDDHDNLLPPEQSGGSLIALHGNTTRDVNVSFVEQQGALQGTGPIKWLFKNGLGWILARTMWLIIFMVGSVFSIFRAGVLFPLMFIGCFLLKTLGWLFGDFFYGFMWEGDTAFLKTIKDPFKCAPWMWKAVGFETGDGGFDDTVGQIVVQPASFASWATGVYHPYKSIPPPDPCKDVTCGTNAYCSVGRCFCGAGFYPVKGTPDCGLVITTNGCVCAKSWIDGLFNQKYYGCASSGKCMVDKSHPTYATCKEKLKKKGLVGILTSAATGSSYSSHDRCSWYPGSYVVPKVQIPQGHEMQQGKMQQGKQLLQIDGDASVLQQLDNQSHALVVAEASHKVVKIIDDGLS